MGGNLDPDTYRRRSVKALVGLALVMGLFFYAFRMVRVKGHSMDPTFHNGQWLLIRRNNWPSPPLKVGDVVVFRMDDDVLVKRIAALGGQTAPEPRELLLIRPSHQRPGSWETAVVPTPPRHVPNGQLYVLGDNPPVSDDSRSFGPVPVSALLGRVLRWKDPGPPKQRPRQQAER
jgi:signal peptidase I